MSEQKSCQNNTQMRGKKDSFMDKCSNKNSSDVTKPTSLSTHILWNIAKAQEKDPSMRLKDAIIGAQARLESECDVSAMIPDAAAQRHLACAVLAWQQLGHSGADSLCQFVSSKAKEKECTSTSSHGVTPDKTSMGSSLESKYSKDVHSMSFGSNCVGPVVKLPVETKIVMRIDNSTSARQTCKKPKAPEKSTMNKIEAACCVDSACADRLTKMDGATTELRMRAGTLAKREAERVELLERAEAAWKDLELGYQRRLTLAEEKEEDLTKQIQKTIEERNGNKNACTTLASQLREKGDKAEIDRAALNCAEKEVCERACLRLKLSEESAQGDTLLAEHQCRAAQLERDLLFKEEQARRKLLNFQSELESSQTITHETERAMRAELSALREQIAQVSEQLLGEDAENARIRNELNDLRQEKMGMVEDLEGCKAVCDSRMQGKVDDLKKKRDQLGELKDKVMECRCKLPVDVVVEVKRTASLAALCRCSPEEKILESCSCTSLRSSLLSNLLGDLFSGLQAEMGGTGTQMPCQLLKCLEDKHNWDRASIVKTNLKNYFSQLLIGELDIAIATSIEKYHAKWVGQSCADTSRMIPDPGEAENEGWQERAIERRAQKLATKLAEQLFQERADQLTQRAKDITTSGPPPCECKPQKACGKEGAAVYPVLISGKPMSPLPVIGPTTPANTPAYWRQTMQDVTQLRVQIEDLKKESIKKEDLKLMEEKISKIVQRGSGIGKSDIQLDPSNTANDITIRKEQKVSRAMNSNQSNIYLNLCKPTSLKKKPMEANSNNKKGQKNTVLNNGPEKSCKPYKRLGQTYAINMCMCSHSRDPNKINQQNKILDDSVLVDCKGRDKMSKDSIPQPNSVKQTKPINSSLHSRDISTRTNSKSSGQQSCPSNCKCFHKIPSNTSIDKLLETLAKWKSDLNSCEKETPCCNFLPGKEIGDLNDKKSVQNDLNKGAENENTFIDLSDTTQRKKEPDIDRECADDCKISSRSRTMNKPEQMKSNPSTFCDRQSSKTNQNFTKMSGELDKEQKYINSKNTIDSIRSNTSHSNREVEESNLNKGVCCNSITNTKNKHSNPFAPTITESEYMGAINLDKSNEDFCKCVKEDEMTSDPFKCMPCTCSCKSLNTKKDVAQNNKYGEVLVGEPGTQNKNKKKGREKEVIGPAKVQKNSNNGVENKLKKAEIFPCDCGYDIQFLGVTLTDIDRNDMETDEIECVACNKPTKDSKLSCDKSKNNNKKLKKTTNAETEFKESINNDVKDENKRELCNKCQLYKRIKTKDEINITCESTPCCECKENFDDLKKYVEVSFQNQQTSEDKSFDVQSFKEGKDVEKPCVCCNKQEFDGSEDLEQNTFILLEEHLKKKLDDFKESSCNSTCIPPEEEEKLFTTILNRVKQIITYSTNQISCKCASEENNSKGSWNRAYGLLQEYLKTKIQRVQCSCETEDNKEVVLPEVLHKVCNLIENDFQRLKDVCGCKRSENQDTDKQVNFKEQVPERDNDIPSFNNNFKNKKIDDCCSQNPQTTYINKENNSSQVPHYLGMETKSCDALETYAKKVQTTRNTQENLESSDSATYCICGEKNVDAELLGTIELKQSSESVKKNEIKNKPARFSNSSYVACVCRDIECIKNNEPVLGSNNTSIVNDILKNPMSGQQCCGKLKSILNNKPIQNTFEEPEGGIQNENTESSNKNQICLNADVSVNVELLSTNKKNTFPISDLMAYDCTSRKSNNCCENNTTINVKSEKIFPFPNKPYIGYTLNCSCDDALGACVCTKSIFQPDNSAMDNIMKNGLPNDKYFEKISYIMKINPTANINYQKDFLSDMTGDLYLHNLLKHKTLYEEDTKRDDETEASFYGNEDMILKGSREFYEMAHTTTNTFDDNISLSTDYSNTEAPLDWCECCSQMQPRQLNSDQLKQSIYFPDPLENVNQNDIQGKYIESVSKTTHNFCDCDLVPICHVKMLVENIEDKLVSAKCTCDSMIPKVCPIHSTEL